MGIISFVFVVFMVIIFLSFNLILMSHFNIKLISHSIMSYIFFGFLAAIVAIIWMFYFYLTLFQAVTFLFPIVVSLIFVGNMELSNCKESRYILQKSGTKKE